jgi:hypothetical protein
MAEERGSGLAPPGGMRPAQLGVVVVGRVVLGHIGATVADLAQRGFLELTEQPGDGEGDWVLIDRRGQASQGDVRLLRFEATLLHGLVDGRPSVRLGERGPDLVRVLERVRAQIVGDAVRRGWLRRFRSTRRTSQGDQLLASAQAFRRELRALVAAGDRDRLAGLAPYAMIFGLAKPPTVGPEGTGRSRSADDEFAVAWAGADRFATSWLGAFEGCSPNIRRGFRRRASGADFAREWSAPHGHHHAAGDGSHAAGHGADYGHASAHDAFGGGHAGY